MPIQYSDAASVMDQSGYFTASSAGCNQDVST